MWIWIALVLPNNEQYQLGNRYRIGNPEGFEKSRIPLPTPHRVYKKKSMTDTQFEELSDVSAAEFRRRLNLIGRFCGWFCPIKDILAFYFVICKQMETRRFSS